MTTEQSTAQKFGTIVLWVLTVGAAAGLMLAGVTKFTSSEMWIGMFADWSYPAWFVYVIGALEVGGAIALLVPRLATYAAILLGLIMASAAITVVANQSDLGVVPSLGNLVVVAIVGFARRDRRWKPG